MQEVSDNTVSLYFGLHEGKNADLEIISRAAIEWVNSIRHSAKMIDPSLDIRVEFVNAHEGSLSINTILDWGEAQLERLEKIKHPRLAKLAVALAIFLMIDAGPASDYWFGSPDELELSQEDRKLLNNFLEEISRSEELKNSNRNFFNVISNDKAVSFVGVCEAPGSPPAYSVPSSQFGERSGLWEQEADPNERFAERVSDVVLETPDLSNEDRKWRFLDIATGKRFTAKMRDEEFVNLLASGGIEENLRMGIKMQIQIRFTERLVDGEWQSLPSTIEVLKVTLA
ncbi:hypothetical protein [Ruegeria jejuensis]|uniref:hypothetical protein n=1 Tax=Ruegeria jejuensis TaxID=3233338 RepID=UPI00355BBA42